MAVSAIRSPHGARFARDESRPGYSFGGLQLDDVEKRWRRLVGPQFRERTCSFRCSTVCACEASAAFYRLSLITSLAVGRS